MSYFTQYKLKDGRKIRGRYDSKSIKICISRSDLEGLIHEADVAYEQAEQLQTIIVNLLEIKRQAITEVLDKVRAEIENHCALAKENKCYYCYYCHNVMGVREILDIIDKYRKGESE